MKLCRKQDCVGCSGCANVCPRHAITMEKDERGFLYPIIDTNKCINCNICSKFCSKLEYHMAEKEHSNNYLLSYATKIKNEQNRMESQSGGLFYALAETIIEKNGVVYGASINNDNYVKHTRVDNIKELYKLRGSKYVQSDIENCFKMIIDDLKLGKVVLFSGTPCQVAGIESLLDFKNINKDNFYSCDIICHGVPSPAIFEKYIKFIEKKSGGKIKNFNFRDKKIGGWKNTIQSYLDKNDSLCSSNIYSDLFYSNLTLRTSCETCKYTSLNRPGDITIGDCWGFEKYNLQEWNDDKGISVGLIQTEKGNNLFEMAKDKLDSFKINNYSQPNLLSSSKKPYSKDKFWIDYKNYNFEKLLKKYTIYGGYIFKIKRKILKMINRW